MDDDGVDAVLRRVPEFADRYAELARAADGEPGTAVMLEELAVYVAELAGQLGDVVPVLERCLDAVEELARCPGDVSEVVTWAFLDTLSPEELARLGPMFGPRTTELLHELDDP